VTVKITPLTRHIGAEISGLDLGAELAPEDRALLRQAWLDHVVVLVRDQKLDHAGLIRFASCFGEVAELSRPKEYRPQGQDDIDARIMLISNIRENGEPIGALPDGDMMFHHDMMHADMPDNASVLHAVEIPSHGGNTLFASGYAAYDALPDDLREPLEGRMAFHHYNYGSTHKGDDKGTEAFSESTHPVFPTNPETGRKAIYVNRLMTDSIVGLPRDRSDALLSRIYDHSEKPEFVYEHVWRVGDVLIWDNRCSMHGRTDFPETERRLMWRCTVKGTERPA
jgi:alpha-ketoglutarate-dependent taurine dioxygenase